MRINLILRAVLLAGGISLLAAACGGDDSGSPFPSDSASGDAPDDEPSAPTDDGASGDDRAGTDQADALIGTWAIQTFQLAGAEGEEPVIAAPSVTFDGAGMVTFDTGCNTGEGEYETWGAYYVPEDEDDVLPEGQPISFGSLSRTEIACDDEFFDQDLAIPGAIRAAASFDLTDGTLTLWRDGNVMISAISG